MLDFVKIKIKEPSRKDVAPRVYPKFVVKNKPKDLMIRGSDFYAVWNEEIGLWSTDEGDVLYLIDRELGKVYDEYKDKYDKLTVDWMWDADSGSIDRWHKYCQKQMRDCFHQLDEKLIFANSEIKKTDYASKKLPYSLSEGSIQAWDRLMSVLYSEEERMKIEWAIGAIVSGDSKEIQKFLVLYGSHGTGKSTVLNIIEKLFEGYCSAFNAKVLGMTNSSFALEAFKSNPLVAIQHDGNLSRIEDNTRLNSLVSHESMIVNEKFKSAYVSKFNSFLLMGTNNPVKITDSKSGILRRLIDVTPTGNTFPQDEYNRLYSQIDFELGAIAWHCLQVYKNNKYMYRSYVPVRMLGASNSFYNYILELYDEFANRDGVTLNYAWDEYKKYCEYTKANQMPRMIFAEELKSYFEEFHERYRQDGERKRSYYRGFKKDKFTTQPDEPKPSNDIFELNCTESLLDTECADCPAQYATSKETPFKAWSKVKTKLMDIDTKELHYVQVPDNHIVIDFDLKDEKGNKSYMLNSEAARVWPPTYAEVSKGGQGIHLHYIYNGDVTKLAKDYAEDIEIKVFTGGSSLRRKLSRCNDIPIATIDSGLPLRKERKMVNRETFTNVEKLKDKIKDIIETKKPHGATKPCIDYIYKLLEDAYESGKPYDLTNLRSKVMTFAMGSSHQSEYCVKKVCKMHFASDIEASVEETHEKPIAFFDVEVFPNLFVVVYKVSNGNQPIIMINPSPKELNDIYDMYNWVGFNNRRYDNHIMYARMIGYSLEELYKLSKKIINQVKGCFFREAYGWSYTDIYDFSSKKQSLKKWEIELGIHHQELGLDWDSPVPEEMWNIVAEYCVNDVVATEALFHARHGDWVARKILAEIAGMTVNDTTNSLTTRIIFGNERKPKLNYPDIREEFPGYEHKLGEDRRMHNMYRGVDLGMGGYVYAKHGMWGNVALIDVASMHPTSIDIMNLFGEYTDNFRNIKQARLWIKHEQYDEVRNMFDGKLARYLDNQEEADALSYALKIAINSVYGLTAATFENPFRDERNVNNIVALRGALFMKTLQDEVTNMGYNVVHIKTDSIKIADADKKIIDFCMEFAQKYGYTFEHEATYEKMCLVNNAVYIAQYKTEARCKELYGYSPKDNSKHGGDWTATGAQFAHPYIFKKYFSKEPIEFKDLCETKTVTSSLYLDFNEGYPDVTEFERLKELRDKDLAKLNKREKELLENNKYLSVLDLDYKIAEGHNYKFVGKAGSFCPVMEGKGGGLLVREKDGKYNSATGAKGFRWMEAEQMDILHKQGDIDMEYFNILADEAIRSIGQYCDFNWFASDDIYISDNFMNIPEDVDEEIPF